MAFKSGKRSGKTWDDVISLDKIIKEMDFNKTSKSEKAFENNFEGFLEAKKDRFNGKLITQVSRESSVKSVYCFGKNHRPDFALDEDGIGIEIKYIDYSFDGLKMALGQSLVYRIRYKFVVTILIISDKNKDVYEKTVNGEEKDLADILERLSEEMNIFTYIVPGFSTEKKNIKHLFEVNNILEKS